MNTEHIRVLVLPQDGEFVLQCLEVDVAATGKTLREARNNFAAVFRAHFVLAAEHGTRPLEGIKPAPAWYAERYEAAMPMIPELKMDVRAGSAPAVATFAA
jgi:hypothetical protein